MPNFGEWFVICFIAVAVVSYPLWPWLGGRMGERLYMRRHGLVRDGAKEVRSPSRDS